MLTTPFTVQACRVDPRWWRCYALFCGCSCGDWLRTGWSTRIMCPCLWGRYSSGESCVFLITPSVPMWDRWGPMCPWLIKVSCFSSSINNSVVCLPLQVRPTHCIFPPLRTCCMSLVEQVTTDWEKPVVLYLMYCNTGVTPSVVRWLTSCELIQWNWRSCAQCRWRTN